MKLEAGALGRGTGAGLLLGGLIVAALVRLWIAPLGSSLGLDEFGTWWVTNGSFDEILARARLFPQSVPYAAVVWLARALGGAGEVVLRLPSLLAAGAAAYWLYRLGRELFDRETGLLSAAVFVGFREVCFAAGDARPYALAVLATVGALWMLVRWLETSRGRDAVGYVILACAAVYFQYLFATMFVVHAAYAMRRWRRGAGVRPWQLLAAVAGIGLLTAPAGMLAREIGRDRALHAFEAMPGAKALVLALVPTGALAALLGSALVWRALGLALPKRALAVPAAPARNQGTAPVPLGDALWLLALSAVVPPVLLFLISRATGTSMFVPRYMMCILPGQALLFGWCVGRAAPVGGGRAIVAVYLLVQIVARGLKVAHTSEDWRGAAAAVVFANGGHTVFLSGTYTESRDLDRVRDDAHAAYLRAPLDYYPTGGPAVVLPLAAGRDAESYVQRLLETTVGARDGFALIERSSKFPSWAPWLEKRLGPKGYRMRKVWDRGNPSAWVFERADASAGRPG